MGKNGDFDDCVDFDPPAQPTPWFNLMDTPRSSASRWVSNYWDDFDAPKPANPATGTAVLDQQPIVDDECYMGKNGDFGECVDFDPPRATRSFNAMDAPRSSASKWVSNYWDDFDAPTPANPATGTAVLDRQPIVDDECYMGKNGDFDDCVDFDPPAQPTPWFNLMDTPRSSASRWVSNYWDDFDAPKPANPATGTAVLDQQPIVDDECYMGKNGDFDDCVDFDPPAVPASKPAAQAKRTRSANAQDVPRDAPRWTQTTQNLFANIVKED